jgi:hypothetical protein
MNSTNGLNGDGGVSGVNGAKGAHDPLGPLGSNDANDAKGGDAAEGASASPDSKDAAGVSLDSDTASGSMTIDIAPRKWVDVLTLFEALTVSGDAQGKRIAHEQLTIMAQTADMAAPAIQRLSELGEDAFLYATVVPLYRETRKRVTAQQAGHAHESAGADSGAGALGGRGVQGASAAPMAAPVAAPVAVLASAAAGCTVLLEVCYSAAGFYLGTYRDGEPHTRESAEYWRRRDAAQSAMATGTWTQRENL